MFFRGAIILAVLAGAGAAQTSVDPSRLAEAARELRPDRTQTALACSVDPMRPTLNFAFRFQTGYLLRLRLNLYGGAKHHVDMVFRVTPAGPGRQPFYFQDAIDFPAAPAHANAEVRGVFLLGEGHYSVTWRLTDEQGRVCRKEWSLDARATHNERVLMPPGTAADLAWRPPPADAGAADTAAYPRRVTLLLNAALPASTRSRGAGASRQWATLVTMVAALVQRLPAATVRLVVFNLDQQRELFHDDTFTLDGMNRVAHAADGAQQWTVDYHVLQHPTGAWDLLAKLVNRELHAADPSDAVVFLGLPWRTAVKMPADFPGAPETLPRFLYLQHRTGMALRPGGGGAAGPMPRNPNGGTRGGRSMPPPGVNPGLRDEPDAVDRTARRMKGKTLTVYTPSDFDKAIQEIERRGK